MEKLANSAACFSYNFMVLILQKKIAFRKKALFDFSSHWFVSFKTFKDSSKFLFTKGVIKKI